MKRLSPLSWVAIIVAGFLFIVAGSCGLGDWLVNCLGPNSRC